ncbi:neo-calmodulin-like [Ruditapes philippinarum]|uniref:neo-calmodulin-like n=1 Tax=Ruditapes philippinarum TaxID=129788 RepID=UPI00295C0A7C|nr:neo-calmodulin-like [Ruditapes philippinarum]
MSMYEVGAGDLHLSQEEVEDFQEAFGLFDREGLGSITVDDLKVVLRSLGKNPSDEELRDMIREVDDDESGTIEFPEFLTMMVRKVKAPETQKELIDAFRVFDYDNNGFVSTLQLRHVLTSLGEKLNMKEIEELIRQGDRLGRGQINYVEFVKKMSR